MSKYFKLIDEMFKYTKADKLELSALEERYDIFSELHEHRPVWITINDDRENQIWGYVKREYENNKYICKQVIETNNFTEDDCDKLLSCALEILYNIDTELKWGITITKYKDDFKIIRNIIKQEYDWASDYWDKYIQCPKCECDENEKEFQQEWVGEDFNGYYIYHCPGCEHSFKLEDD
jgi:hypothetical protein